MYARIEEKKSTILFVSLITFILLTQLVAATAWALGTQRYVHHGLGSDAYDGTWRTFERDLLDDLHDAQPGVDIINVDAFLIRGSGYVDEIKLLPRENQGDFVVPSGKSYMQLQNVDSRPTLSSWHGPTYVQVLDRPFRLYQLDDFAVLGKLNQGPNSEMGKIRVSLYDDSMKEILRIIWRDCWAASAKTQIRTIYKDANGNTHTASPGYIYGDAVIDARMWYQASTETIKSTIDGMTATHATAADPARVVKYMVIQGHRYQGNSLIDLRIKDINVKVDLNAENPNAPEPGEPVEYDGTNQGPSDADVGEKFVGGYEQMASEAVSATWDGPWPVLNIACNLIVHSLSFIMTLKVDLLGSLSVTELTLTHPVLDSATDEQLQASTDTVMALSPVRFYSAVVSVSRITAKFFATFGKLPGAQGAFAASLLAYVTASIMLTITIAQEYMNSALSALDAFIGLVVLVWGVIFAGNTISKQSIFGRLLGFLDKYRSTPLEDWGYHDTFF
ncbi:MAG: hypothetical protein GF309_15185, partial [Candidatus Lokiarchaeota archaeon]|nr:hypothetical protein [Candidatus Lokiarchaeota archaeon]